MFLIAIESRKKVLTKLIISAICMAVFAFAALAQLHQLPDAIDRLLPQEERIPVLTIADFDVAEDEIYISGGHSGYIQVFGRDGTFLRSYRMADYAPSGWVCQLCVRRDALVVYFEWGERALVLERNGAVRKEYALRPYYWTYQTDNNVALTDYGFMRDAAGGLTAYVERDGEIYRKQELFGFCSIENLQTGEVVFQTPLSESLPFCLCCIGLIASVVFFIFAVTAFSEIYRQNRTGLGKQRRLAEWFFLR